MEETPKLDLNSHLDVFESEHNMGTQKISVSDHINSFQYAPEMSDSFVIDMDAFSSGINKDNNTNSGLTFQRSFSRKGSQRGGDKKVNGSTTLHVHDRDTVPATCSPKGGMVVSGMAEKPAVVALGSTDHSTNTQVHHQITVMAGNMSSSNTESRSISRRNSMRRSSWAIDPKRVLLFFATLSSMGTMLLIYFTLTISKHNANEYGADWQQ